MSPYCYLPVSRSRPRRNVTARDHAHWTHWIVVDLQGLEGIKRASRYRCGSQFPVGSVTSMELVIILDQGWQKRLLWRVLSTKLTQNIHVTCCYELACCHQLILHTCYVLIVWTWCYISVGLIKIAINYDWDDMCWKPIDLWISKTSHTFFTLSSLAFLIDFSLIAVRA